MVFVVAVAGQAACAAELAGPPELVVGFGETELVLVADGDRVPIATGPQGGTIVWGAAELRNVDPIGIEMRFEITPPQGRATLRRARVDLVQRDGALVTLAHPVFLPDEQQFSGVPCVMTIEARDRDGRIATGETTIVPTR